MKKAMILAAGKGTRLKPFTDNMPKALFPVKGVPMLEYLILKLKFFDFTDIIINVHHFADKITDFLTKNNNFGVNITISYESELLETGGGLKKVKWFFNSNESFLVHNVDILSEINFNELSEAHNSGKSLATLAVSERVSNRYFLFNDEMELKGWKNLQTGEEKVFSSFAQNRFKALAFSGIQIISPHIFPLMPKTNTFSLTDLYINICDKNKIKAFIHKSKHWKDVGKAAEWLKK